MPEKEMEEEEETCAGCMAKEMQLKSILPTGERKELFFDSQWSWGQVSVAYVVYRNVVAGLVIAWAVADFFGEAGRWYSFNYAIWLVFATNWSLLFLTISCVVMAATTTYYFFRSRHAIDAKEMRLQPIGCGLALQWILYNVAANTNIVVSISYWAFVVIIDGSGFLTTSMSQLKHTLNTIYVIVDMFVNAVPIRVVHLVYPLAIGIAYAIFNAVYFMNDGLGPNGRPYAYYVLDWRNPLGSSITCLLGFILCIFVQGILYAIYRLRVWFRRKLTSRIREDLERPVLGKDNGRGGDEEDEEDSIFSQNPNTSNYRSVNDLELRTG